ncbi:hypothetical protein BD413DRAFT_531765 [Trametes elegans]|nr:hypothetical protein BD413DRAFT_531765 [Trametes elegans]
MTLGPPPSAAGPSGNAPPEQNVPGAYQTTAAAPTATPATSTSSVPAPPSAPTPGPSVSTGPYTGQFSVQPQPAPHAYYTHPSNLAYPAAHQAHPTQPSHPHQSPQNSARGHYPPHNTYYAQQQPQAQGAPRGQTGAYSYYNYPSSAWANAWNAGSYQYGPGGRYPYSYAQPAPQQSAQQAAAPQTVSNVACTPPPLKRKTPTPTPSPSPPPPPEYHMDWDAVIKTFLSAIGFSQSLRGFEADMVVLNPEYERKKVPAALGELLKDLLKLGQGASEPEGGNAQGRPLEERKLDYIHLANGATPRSQTSITKDISRFLARNRARNDASNRNEFLLSLAEKRRRLNENGKAAPSEPIPSCARTDAKTQNRDLQMKYDIAKNEDGPLRRTLKTGATGAPESNAASRANVDSAASASQSYPGAERYSALDERLQNVETHLAIRYVPSPPRSLLDRLKYIEDHIIHLEKEYPPWAALHFNQPHRGWPPPPRPTPIIVPSHLTSTTQAATVAPASTSASGQVAKPTEAEAKGRGKAGWNTKSSLHRAVMERLEVQKAIKDYNRGDGG